MSQWLPLESNPEVFADYLTRLEGPNDLIFSDVFALDISAFDFVPKPVIALLFVFPLTTSIQRRYKDAQFAVGQQLKHTDTSLWFTKQSIPNACGTVALLHIVMNLPPEDPGVNEGGKYSFASGGPLGKIREVLTDIEPAQRARAMEKDEVLGKAHQSVDTLGDTKVPSREEGISVNEHFVAFVRKSGKLYELDGRQDGPIYHGKTTSDTFLQDCANVIKAIMALDSNVQEFSLLAVSERPTGV